MTNNAIASKYSLPILYVVLSVIIYSIFAFGLVRTEHLKLFSLYGALFFLFYKTVKSKGVSIKYLIGTAILLRLVFLFAIPNLSQDFYRFLWDGRLMLAGFNPYLYTPQSFIDYSIFPIQQAQELYDGMGALNGSHFTNYPPVNQLCFAIAGLLAGKSIIGSVIVLRSLIILADIGIIYFGRKLLKQLGMNERNIFWFILNPLIIIELTGNLHFEGVMLFFLVWALYLLSKGLFKWSGVIFALSISTKLIPLMFLPLFWGWFIRRSPSLEKDSITNESENEAVIGHNTDDKKLGLKINESHDSTFLTGFKKLIVYYLIVVTTSLMLFSPFYSSQFINNYAQTVGLWFQNFEFNASIYYLLREIGYSFRGYNEIAIIGKWTAIIVFVSIMVLSFLRKNINIKQLFIGMLIAFSIYLFTTTTVHPWYLSTLLLLSVFTRYKFAIVWSATIILSYFAYKTEGFNEQPYVLIIEYTIVFAVLVWELFFRKKELKTN